MIYESIRLQQFKLCFERKLTKRSKQRIVFFFFSCTYIKFHMCFLFIHTCHILYIEIQISIECFDFEHKTITDKLSNRIDYNFYCQRLKWIKVTWNSEIEICIEYKESNNNTNYINYNNSKEQKYNRLWVACDLWNRVKKETNCCVVQNNFRIGFFFFFHSNRILSKWIIESNRSKCTQSQMIRAA